MEGIKEQISQITDTTQLCDIQDFCAKRIIELIDAEDISIEEKINRICSYNSSIDRCIMSGGVWDEIIDYIDGIPNRNETVHYNNLVSWIDNYDNENYDAQVKAIYEEVKNGSKGFIWDW